MATYLIIINAHQKEQGSISSVDHFVIPMFNKGTLYSKLAAHFQQGWSKP